MTGSLRHLSSPDSPRRVRCLLAARGGCCFPASHRGGNDPLLLLYRPGSRSLRASDDSGRERDGNPQSGVHILYQTGEKGQKGPRRCYCSKRRRATPESGISGLFPAGGFEPSTVLSKNGLPRRVRHLLAARERCCFPASHRGGNSPLLLLYRPGSRSLRASDDSERKRDGTPHPYCGAYECF